MKSLLTAAAVLGISFAAGSSSSAQPLLDRVEQQVRKQLEGPPPAGAAPAVEPGYLGILADDQNETGNGVRLLQVMAGGPAALGGLRKDDVITAINRQPVGKISDMGPILQRLPVGSKVDFQVMRGGVEQRIEVTLGSRPAPADQAFPQFGRQPGNPPATGADAPPSLPPAGGGAPLVMSTGPKLGVRTTPVTEDAARQYRLSSTAGAIVTTVVVGSAAEKAGIPLGAVILAVNGQPVNVPDDLATYIRQSGYGATIDVTYVSRGQEATAKVTLPEAPAGAAPVGPTPATGPVTNPGFIPGDGPPLSSQPPLISGPLRPMPDESRIEQLERRVRELEDRIMRLEAAAKQ